jgi:hypothetical protein
LQQGHDEGLTVTERSKQLLVHALAILVLLAALALCFLGAFVGE